MINEDLIEYIQHQLKKNVSEENIIMKLSNAGWIYSDILEGLKKVKEPVFIIPKTVVEEKIAEQIEKIIPQKDPTQDIAIEIDTKDEPKIETPKEVKVQQEVKVEKEVPVFPTTKVVEPQYLEIEKPELKVWTPSVREPQIAKTDIQKEVENIPKDSIIKEIPPMAANFIKKPEVVNDNSFLPELSKKDLNKDTQNTATPNVISLIPNPAMISSYQKDMVESIKTSSLNQYALKKKKIKIVIIVLIIILLFGGGYFLARHFGFLKQPIITKDPQIELLSALSNFSKRESYSVDTRIDVSMPALSSITGGLISGEEIVSNQKDSISIETKGKVNNKNKEGYFFDYQGSIKSTLLAEDILTHVKFTDNLLYVKVPQLKKIFGINAPNETWVETTTDKMNLIFEVLPTNITAQIKRIDVYNILSKGVPPYVQDKINKAVINFVNNTPNTLVGTEEINGKLSYHYLLQPDRKTTKELLTSVLSIFQTNFSEEQSKQIDEVLGSITFDSIDVWVGTNDSMLYQYNFKIRAPLSKIVALDDKGLAEKEVTLDWKTSYTENSDSSKTNIPSQKVVIEKYIQTINDLKTKDIVDTFRVYARNFNTTFGNYGRANNAKGDCLHPVSGSLFSPLGHSAKGDIVVGDISKVMQDLLDRVPTGSVCYSTGSSWAMAAPYSDGTTYCIDSSGFGDKTSVPLAGVICKK